MQMQMQLFHTCCKVCYTTCLTFFSRGSATYAWWKWREGVLCDVSRRYLVFGIWYMMWGWEWRVENRFFFFVLFFRLFILGLFSFWRGGGEERRGGERRGEEEEVVGR